MWCRMTEAASRKLATSADGEKQMLKSPRCLYFMLLQRLEGLGGERHHAGRAGPHAARNHDPSWGTNMCMAAADSDRSVKPSFLPTIAIQAVQGTKSVSEGWT